MSDNDLLATGLDRPNATLHRIWLQNRVSALFDAFEAPSLNRPSKLYQTARLVHCFAVSVGMGRPGAHRHVDEGMNRLQTGYRDPLHGGFFAELASDGGIATDNKDCYGHAFVLLAAASAKKLGHPDADRLLGDVLAVLDGHFWDPSHGAARESFSRDWRDEEPYRGQNANMHLAEACMAAFEATGETIHLQRAQCIAELIIDRHARGEGWRIPEHFTRDWTADRAYEGVPRFRPYGTTPGHSFEWSRLLLQLWTLSGRTHPWLPDAAAALFRRAWADAWRQDGGLLYTIDWNGTPARRERLSWPCCEAIGAAVRLDALEIPGASWADHYRTVWAFVAEHFIDGASGTWFVRLPERGRSSFRPDDRPDLYHALQACLLSLLPSEADIFSGLRAGWAVLERTTT